MRFGAALAPEVLDALEDREGFTRELVAFFDRANEYPARRLAGWPGVAATERTRVAS